LVRGKRKPTQRMNQARVVQRILKLKKSGSRIVYTSQSITHLRAKFEGAGDATLAARARGEGRHHLEGQDGRLEGSTDLIEKNGMMIVEITIEGIAMSAMSAVAIAMAEMTEKMIVVEITVMAKKPARESTMTVPLKMRGRSVKPYEGSAAVILFVRTEWSALVLRNLSWNATKTETSARK